MDERTSTVVKDIFKERQKLGENLAELEIKVREAANWRTYFNKNPWMMMGLAAGGGFILSALFAPRSRY